MRNYCILYGFVFALNDWDHNSSSGILYLKEKIIDAIVEFAHPNDLFLIYPNKEILTTGYAVAEILNNNSKCKNLFSATSDALRRFNDIDELIVKKLFVFTNHDGISGSNNKVLDKINKSFTQIFLLGIKNDIENFAFFENPDEIYPVLKTEMMDLTE